MFRLARRVSLAVLMITISAITATAQSASTSGKLAVGGDSAGAVGILRVNVDPSLDGPLIVTVKDSSSSVVTQGGSPSLTLNLGRNKNTATVSIALAAGTNQITVADKNVAAETVTVNWQPDTAYPVPGIAPNTFAKSTVNPVRSDKLWAEADRIADKPEFALLKVHVDKGLSGFDAVVTKTNAAGETVEIDRRHFDLPRNGSTEYSAQVKLDSSEACTIVITAPGTTDTATIQVPAMTASFRQANASETEQREAVLYQTEMSLRNLISWLTLSYGRWENFEIETPSGLKDAMGNDILVRQRPYRIEALGWLKIPETPFIIGFDGNFGKGPDDVRFIFGTRFDIGKVLHTIRAAAARDDMGSSSPNP